MSTFAIERMSEPQRCELCHKAVDEGCIIDPGENRCRMCRDVPVPVVIPESVELPIKQEGHQKYTYDAPALTSTDQRIAKIQADQNAQRFIELYIGFLDEFESIRRGFDTLLPIDRLVLRGKLYDRCKVELDSRQREQNGRKEVIETVWFVYGGLICIYASAVALDLVAPSTFVLCGTLVVCVIAAIVQAIITKKYYWEYKSHTKDMMDFMRWTDDQRRIHQDYFPHETFEREILQMNIKKPIFYIEF